MKQQLCVFICCIFSLSIYSQKKASKCEMYFDLSRLGKPDPSLRIVIDKFQPDSANRHVVFAELPFTKSRFTFISDIPDPYSLSIELKKGDSVLMYSGSFIACNEKIQISFPPIADWNIDVQSKQTDFDRRHGSLLLAIPAIIYRSDNFNRSIIKRSYEVYIPEDRMLQHRVKEYESDVLDAVWRYREYYTTLENLWGESYYLSPKTMDSALKILAKHFKHTSLYKKVAIYVEQSKKLIDGKKLFAFTAKDLNNETVASETFVGQKAYTYIDFWASWCIPCRKSIRTVRSIYDKIDTAHIQFVSISFDEDVASCKKAIAQDDIIWKNLIDINGFKGTIAKAFNITAIPSSILLDKEGKIIHMNMADEKLIQFLQEKQLLAK